MHAWGNDEQRDPLCQHQRREENTAPYRCERDELAVRRAQRGPGGERGGDAENEEDQEGKMDGPRLAVLAGGRDERVADDLRREREHRSEDERGPRPHELTLGNR